jgi:peptidoglycan/LPS O-acetylase OafA/YrhL
MKPRRVVFLVGFALYAISFPLVAVDNHIPNSNPDRGYDSAFWSLVLGSLDVMGRLHGHEPITHNLVELFSLLASGLINMIFVIFSLALPIWPQNRAVRTLGLVVLMLLPFCWVVFHYEHMSPRTGYFLWVLGMLLVVFSKGVNKVATAH